MLKRKCPFCGCTFMCTGDCCLKEKIMHSNYCGCYQCFKMFPMYVTERYSLLIIQPKTFKEKIIVCYGKDFIDSQLIDEL